MLSKSANTSNSLVFGKLYILFPYSYLLTNLIGYLKAVRVFNIPVPVVAISPLFLFCAVLTSTVNLKRISLNKWDIVFMITLVFSVILIPFFACGADVLRFSDKYFEILLGILIPTSAGFVYASFIDRRRAINVFLISFLTVCVVFFIDLSQQRYGVLIGRFGGGAVLSLSDLVASSSLFAMFFVKAKEKASVVVITIVCLLLLNSFTTVVIYTGILLISILIKFRKRQRRKRRFTFFGVVSILTLTFTSILFSKTLWGIIEPFALAIFVRATDVIHFSDGSAVARVATTRDAISVISENFFLGNWGYYFRETGFLGYAHNVLSWWADYGIMAILAVLALQIRKLLQSFKNFRSNGLVLSGSIFLPMMFLVFVELLSRAHRFELIWFFVGISMWVYPREPKEK